MVHLAFRELILVKSVSQEQIKQLAESLTISSQKSITYLTQVMNKLVVVWNVSVPEESLLS